jgi:hypothetical protein
MTPAKRSAAFLLMAIAAAALPAVAQLQLNPLVNVLATPTGPVPADCATGETIAAPRVVIGEPAPEAPAAPAPPSNDLRSALWRLETAAAGDDYAELKTALAAARAAAAAFPPGGERNAANDAVAVYADVERLWDYANSSATGAFFDASAESGALLAMLNRYPGFGHALADATMEIDGKTVYPTREARHFLAAEGAKKLTWMGAAPPPAREAVVMPPPLVIQPQPIATPAPATPRRPIPKLRPQPTEAAGLKPGLPGAKHMPHAAKPAAKKPVAPKPAPVQKAPAPVPLPMPAPIVAAPPSAPAPAPAPVTTTTAAPVPAPVAVAPQPTTTTPAEKPEAVGGRINLLLALILIVVGLGVLIFLFRASD